MLAPMPAPHATLAHIARTLELDDTYPPAVHAEVEAWLAAPGLDDPALIDLTPEPFVTIDNEGSRDLDQALAITRDGPGYRLRYALADAAYYVRPGSALFAEALARGASYYLPGWSIPMLPRPLSEGLVSLNAGVPRRAMVWTFGLDPQGAIVDVALERARIQSHAQLTYAGVQALHDADARGETHPLAEQVYTESLRLLGEVGRLRLAEARARDVVPHRSADVTVEVDGAGQTFRAVVELRRAVDAWNEQVSVMTNVEAALWLARATSPGVQPIFRGHPPPEPGRLDELEATLEATVAARTLDPAVWRWRRAEGESLSDYLARLPEGGPEQRRVDAIHRQAIVANQRSAYGTTVAPHHGLGARAYARVTAPMREIVGIYTHKELWELLDGTGTSAEAIVRDEALRAQVIEAGNASKVRQGQLDKACNKLVIDRVLAPELARPRAERRPWCGTIMGVTGDKYYVRLDSPPIEVKVYRRDLGAEAEPLALGDQVDVRVEGHEPRRDRWVLTVARGA
jgi:ribonuclease R